MRKELYRKGSAPAAGSTFLPKGPRINTNMPSIQEEGEGPELKKPTKMEEPEAEEMEAEEEDTAEGANEAACTAG